MTIHTKPTVFAGAETERSKLSSATQAINKHDGEARNYQSGADVIGAERERDAAKAAATEAWLTEDDAEKHAAAKARYRSASERVEEARRAEKAYLAHAGQRSGLVEAHKRAQADVIEAEARRLSAVYHDHELRALRARASVEGLIEAAHGTGDHELAARLRQGLQSLPASTPQYPEAFQTARAALDARLARFRQGWREAAAALAHDAGAAGPDPEEIGDADHQA